MASRRPYKVEHTTREVIERQVLNSLAEGDKVAIIATKEDLKLIIMGLRGVTPPHKWREIHADLLQGAEQLLREAFY